MAAVPPHPGWVRGTGFPAGAWAPPLGWVMAPPGVLVPGGWMPPPPGMHPPPGFPAAPPGGFPAVAPPPAGPYVRAAAYPIPRGFPQQGAREAWERERVQEEERENPDMDSDDGYSNVLGQDAGKAISKIEKETTDMLECIKIICQEVSGEPVREEDRPGCYNWMRRLLNKNVGKVMTKSSISTFRQATSVIPLLIRIVNERGSVREAVEHVGVVEARLEEILAERVRAAKVLNDQARDRMWEIYREEDWSIPKYGVLQAEHSQKYHDIYNGKDENVVEYIRGIDDYDAVIRPSVELGERLRAQKELVRWLMGTVRACLSWKGMMRLVKGLQGWTEMVGGTELRIPLTRSFSQLERGTFNMGMVPRVAALLGNVESVPGIEKLCSQWHEFALMLLPKSPGSMDKIVWYVPDQAPTWGMWIGNCVADNNDASVYALCMGNYIVSQVMRVAGIQPFDDPSVRARYYVRNQVDLLVMQWFGGLSIHKFADGITRIVYDRYHVSRGNAAGKIRKRSLQPVTSKEKRRVTSAKRLQTVRKIKK